MLVHERTGATAFLLLLVVGSSGASTLGCPREDATPPPETPTSERRTLEPDYQVFAPLPETVSGEGLPLLMTKRGTLVESACFAPVASDLGDVPTSDVAEQVEQLSGEVSHVLAQWFRQKVSIAAVGDSAVDAWKIAPVEVFAREIEDRSVRFVENPECIDPSTGWMEEGVLVVAGLFGGRTFRFTSPTPLPRKQAELLREEFTKAGLTFETEDLIDYELVVDEDGRPTKGSKGEKLYRSSDEGTLSELDIVPPERQKMKTWLVETDVPVFFGFRELSKGAWQREADRDRCNVNIVWNDPVFRPPECSEYTGSSFKAAMKGNRVEIQMKTGDDVRTYEMDYDRLEKIHLNDKTILWVSPVKIEEGALIRLNSLVLDP